MQICHSLRRKLIDKLTTNIDFFQDMPISSEAMILAVMNAILTIA